MTSNYPSLDFFDTDFCSGSSGLSLSLCVLDATAYARCMPIMTTVFLFESVDYSLDCSVPALILLYVVTITFHYVSVCGTSMLWLVFRVYIPEVIDSSLRAKSASSHDFSQIITSVIIGFNFYWFFIWFQLLFLTLPWLRCHNRLARLDNVQAVISVTTSPGSYLLLNFTILYCIHWRSASSGYVS